MEKIKKNILANFDGYCLIKYLKKVQPNWTKIFAIKMICAKNVLVNSRRVKWNYKLKKGDIVEFYGLKNDSQNSPQKKLDLKKLKKLNVIFENENLIIVFKEAKISVQADTKNNYLNMKNRLLNHLNFQLNENSWTPEFIHRLDYNTTGLLIGAKNYQTYVELNNAQKSGKIKKYYKAHVHKKIDFSQKVLKNWLIKEDKNVFVSKPYQPKAKYSESIVKNMQYISQKNSSLVEVELKTGRTHQIRVQLAHIKHPIRGDQKYGIEKNKKEYPYPALCSYKIQFSDDIKGKYISILKNKTFETSDIWFEKI